MTLLQVMLLALLCSAAAGSKDHELELFGNHTIPGWLPNIFNPLVWAAFPDAHQYYNEHYLSNVTFDGPGRNYSHPMYPKYAIPTVAPPRPRVVPPYNPIVTGGSDQQSEDPNITPNENSTESSGALPDGAQHPKMLPFNADKKLQLLKKALPQIVFQAVSGTLGSGQTLQQVRMLAPHAERHSWQLARARALPPMSPRLSSLPLLNVIAGSWRSRGPCCHCHLA